MGKSYTNYKQARSKFMRSAFKSSAGQYFPNFSGKNRKTSKKKKKSPVLTAMPEPLTLNIKVDTVQLDEALKKLAAGMTKSARIIIQAMTASFLHGTSAAVIMNGQTIPLDSFLEFERRWLVLQHLGWTRDLKGDLVSLNKLDVLDSSILDDEPDFKRFVGGYLANGKIPEWVSRRYKVQSVEEIALPFDSVRKQLEERISNQTKDLGSNRE